MAKSFYRIIGIFIGAGVALLFVALFAQERVPFLGALAMTPEVAAERYLPSMKTAVADIERRWLLGRVNSVGA